MASTHGPTAGATWTLSTRMRNASTSMSKRAPSALTVRVRRATQPSTASSASATAVIGTSTPSGAEPSRPEHDQGGHPADQHPPGQRHLVRRPEPVGVATAQATPQRDAGDHAVREAGQPTGDVEPDGHGQPGQQDCLYGQAEHRTGSNPGHPASVSMIDDLGSGYAERRRFVRFPGR